MPTALNFELEHGSGAVGHFSTIFGQHGARQHQSAMQQHFLWAMVDVKKLSKVQDERLDFDAPLFLDSVQRRQSLDRVRFIVGRNSHGPHLPERREPSLSRNSREERVPYEPIPIQALVLVQGAQVVALTAKPKRVRGLSRCKSQKPVSGCSTVAEAPNERNHATGRLIDPRPVDSVREFERAVDLPLVFVYV